MKNIKVLGSGCANCKTTMKLIEQAAKACAIEVELEKVEDMQKIIQYGILSTPGVVVDGEVVHSGGIPSKDSIERWLCDSTSAAECCSGSEQQGGGCCG